MSEKDDGGQAFAAAAVTASDDMIFQPGMSLREYYAGQAFPSVINRLADWQSPNTAAFSRDCARLCCRFADALIEELNQ